MAKRKSTIGFGYDPADQYSAKHFLVDIPAEPTADVTVFERYIWDDGPAQVSDMQNCKVKLPRWIWDAVQKEAELALNCWMHDLGWKAGHFKPGAQTPINRFHGPELMALLWAVEPAKTAEQISAIIKYWIGTSDHEHRWFYTMADAQHGLWHQGGKGWRIALFYGMADIAAKEE